MAELKFFMVPSGEPLDPFAQAIVEAFPDWEACVEVTVYPKSLSSIVGLTISDKHSSAYVFVGGNSNDGFFVYRSDKRDGPYKFGHKFHLGQLEEALTYLRG